MVLLRSPKRGIALVHIKIFGILIQEDFVESEEILDIVEKDRDWVIVSLFKFEGMAWERLWANSVLWTYNLSDRELHLLTQAANNPVDDIVAILDKYILHLLDSFAEFLFRKLTRWWTRYFRLWKAWLSLLLTFNKSLKFFKYSLCAVCA